MSPYTNSHKPKTLPEREPVVTATILVPAIVALCAWLGFEVDGETALAIATGLGAVGALIARHFVTPVAKPRRRRNQREG